jgi:FSR family fosmidomycin resistance protein-like MFS transporter
MTNQSGSLNVITDDGRDTAVAPTDQTHFQTDQVITIAGGHFVHDTYSAFLSPLLPVLQERLSTNYALTGGLAIFAQIASLLNPFIGHLADKVSLRYFIILAPAITGTLMSIIGLTSSYAGLAILLFASGISIAAFHAPAPAMIARVSGNRVGQGMSIFMAAGELGRTVGPIVVVAGVEWFGLGGIWRLALVGWLVSGILYFRLRNISARPVAAEERPSWQSILPKAKQIFPALTWLMLARVFMQVALTTYLPIFMSDVLNSSLWLAAASLTILEGAGVVGALATGTISDRLGRSRVLFFLLSLAPLFLIVFLYGPSWLALPLLIALGLTAISPQPVFLALVQDEFPDHRALANGLYLAMNFLIRALAIWVVGFLADRYGLTNAFLWSALLVFLSLPAIRFLPQKA